MLDQFYGMVRDRNGIEQDDKEFYDLLNTRNNFLEGLRKRYGGGKVFSETHTDGTKVHGLFTFTDDAGNKSHYKISDGKLWKSTGGSWSSLGSITNATAYFASLQTKKTGASATDSGTMTNAEATIITDSGKAFTKNSFVGSILEVSNEKKLIGANNATQIFIKERFDDIPSGAAYAVYPRQQEFFIANGTDFYKCDGTTMTQLNTSNFAYAFDGIEAHQGRIFGWKGTRMHWSDLGVGEHFSRNSWWDFETPIQRIKSFGNYLVVYERHRVSVMMGDSPETFQFNVLFPNLGLLAPKTVANYQGTYQMFLSDIGVVIISTDTLAPRGTDQPGEEPISVSQDYIQSLIAAQSSASLVAACAGVNNNEYHLCVDDDWYVLNINASAKTGFRKWIWTRDDRPDAMDANVIGMLDGRFCVGAQDNGQVYHIEDSSFVSDDGTAIAWTIEKQDWNPTNRSDQKRFWALHITQPVGAACTMAYYGDPEGQTYGSALSSIALNTASSKYHKIKIPGNISDRKNIGRDISFKITESSSLLPGIIEEISLLYLPSYIH
jgi:hypothetical protein